VRKGHLGENDQKAVIINKNNKRSFLVTADKLEQLLNNENDQQAQTFERFEFGANQEGCAGLVDVIPRSDASPLHSMKS
jgi:hypothetical protein